MFIQRRDGLGLMFMIGLSLNEIYLMKGRAFFNPLNNRSACVITENYRSL